MKNKKPINSYKSALQTVLNENFATLFGGARPVGGVSTNHPKGYVTGRSTPNIGHGITGPAGPDINIINKEEELTSRAPPLLPFPLDTVFDSIIDTLESLYKVNRQLKTAIDNNVTLSKEKLTRLKNMQLDIEDQIDKITQIGKKIETISITDL